MNAVLMAGLLFSLVLVMLAVRRRADGLAAAVVGVGFAGSALTLAGLLVYPWAVPAPATVFEQNALWLAQHSALLQPLQKVPLFGQALASLDLSSPDSLRASLEQSQAGLLVQQVAAGHSLFSWHLWQLGWRVSPLLSTGLTAAFLASLTSAGLVIASLLSGGMVLPRLGVAVAAAAGLGLLLLVTRMTTVDSLGSSDDFVVRLTAALAQVRVGPGIWWTLLGLVLLIAFGLVYDIAARVSLASREQLHGYEEESGVFPGGWT